LTTARSKEEVSPYKCDAGRQPEINMAAIRNRKC